MPREVYNDLTDEKGRAIHVSLINNKFLSIEARPLTLREDGGFVAQLPEDVITISVERVPLLIEQIMSMLRRKEPPFSI